MEHPFFPMTTTRAEALRWLAIAEKLLSARDLVGSKSFAARARDADPTLPAADQILSVADTLLAGDMRIGNNQHDLYAILRLTPQQGRDAELIARRYRSLALILNPQKNRFPFAEQAFALVLEAWSVLSNPTTKSLYDKELGFYLYPQQQQQQQHHQQQQQPDLFGNPMPALQQNVFAGVGTSGGFTHPIQHQGAVQFSQPQVHLDSQVQSVVGGPVREPQNFMNFTSGTNVVFGTGSMSGVEDVNKPAQESNPNFAGNVASASAPPPPPGPAPAGVDTNHEQAQQSYSNVGEGTSQNIDTGDQVEEGIEDEEDVDEMEAQEEIDAPAEDDGSAFWTACPYCYYMYQYPMVYADCTLRCSNCKSAFQAVIIPSPPVVDGQDGYFCCWGFIPLGFSMDHWERNKGAPTSWTPFSPMFTCPQPLDASNSSKRSRRKSSGPRIYVDDDEAFLEFSDLSGSDDSDTDWRNTAKVNKKKKTMNVKGRGASGMGNRSAKKAHTDKGKNVNVNVNVNVQDGFVSPDQKETLNNPASELSRKEAAISGRKQPARAAKSFGKLDLNVECSNEAEEPAPRVNQENGPSRGEDDNIEGTEFFEGLDDFLSNLPILNVVADDKVVKAA